MAISVVQRNSGGDNNGITGHVAVAFLSNTTAANKLIAIGFISDVSTTSLHTPTDTQSNTWTKVADVEASSGDVGFKVWETTNSTAGGADTVTMNDNSDISTLHIYEVAGVPTAQCFDKISSNSQTSATALTSNNTTTTSHANELLLGLSANVNGTPLTYTVGSGYANIITDGLAFLGSATEEQIVSSSATYAATFTLASNSTDILTAIVTFSDTASGTQYTKSLTATESFVGAAAKTTGNVLSATLSYVGALLGSIKHGLSAALAYAGSLNRTDNYPLSATQVFAPQSNQNTQIVQHIEMSVSANNTNVATNTYVTVPSIMTNLNINDFDGTVSVYFEADIWSAYTDGTHTVTAQLYDLTDSTPISGSQVITTKDSGDVDKVRSGAITLPSGAKVYGVQVQHSQTETNAGYVIGARIIIYQSGVITKTQIHQELGLETAQPGTQTSTTNIPTGVGTFLYNASAYDGTVTVRHDAVLYNDSGTGTFFSGIYDVDAAAVVSGSTISSSTTSATLANIASSGNITLTDGHHYQPTVYMSASPTGTHYMESNKLVFTITSSPTKFLAYIAAVIQDNATTGATTTSTTYIHDDDWGMKFDAVNDFQGVNTTYYHEGLIKISNSSNTVTSNLGYGIDSYTDLTGTEITHTGDTNATVIRSSAISLPSGQLNYVAGLKTDNASATATYWRNYIIAAITGIGSATSNSLPKQTNTLQTATLSTSAAIAKTAGNTLSATLSYIGTFARAIAHKLTGNNDFSANFGTNIYRPFAASLIYVGSMFKFMPKVFTAIESFAGSFSTGGSALAQFFTANMSFVGHSLSRGIVQTLAASENFVGNLTDFLKRAMNASENFSGNTLLLQTIKAFSATTSFVGNISRAPGKALTATVSFAGSLGYTIGALLTAAALSFSANLNRMLGYTFTATESFVGTINNATSYLLTATLSFAGTLGNFFTGFGQFAGGFASMLFGGGPFAGGLNPPTYVNLSANLNFSGALSRAHNVVLAAVMSFVGSLKRALTRILSAATLVLSGSFSWTVALSQSAVTSYVGSLFEGGLAKTFTATTAYIGNLNRSVTYFFTATLNNSGNLAKELFKSFVAATNYVGNLISSPSTVLSATLSFGTNFTKSLGRALTASLNYSAAINRLIGLPLSATEAFAGIVGQLHNAILAASLSFSGHFTDTINRVFTATNRFSGVIVETIIHGITKIIPTTPKYLDQNDDSIYLKDDDDSIYMR